MIEGIGEPSSNAKAPGSSTVQSSPLQSTADGTTGSAAAVRSTGQRGRGRIRGYGRGRNNGRNVHHNNEHNPDKSSSSKEEITVSVTDSRGGGNRSRGRGRGRGPGRGRGKNQTTGTDSIIQNASTDKSAELPSFVTSSETPFEPPAPSEDSDKERARNEHLPKSIVQPSPSTEEATRDDRRSQLPVTNGGTQVLDDRDKARGTNTRGRGRHDHHESVRGGRGHPGRTKGFRGRHDHHDSGRGGRGHSGRRGGRGRGRSGERSHGGRGRVSREENAQLNVSAAEFEKDATSSNAEEVHEESHGNNTAENAEGCHPFECEEDHHEHLKDIDSHSETARNKEFQLLHEEYDDIEEFTSEATIPVSFGLAEAKIGSMVSDVHAQEKEEDKKASEMKSFNVKDRLHLPTIPASAKFGNISSGMGMGMGVPMILSRQSHPPQSPSISTVEGNATQLASLSLIGGILGNETNGTIAKQKQSGSDIQPSTEDPLPPKVPKAKKIKKQKEKTKKSATEEGDNNDVEVNPVKESAIEALEKLPAQAVSITADTHIKILRSASSNSLENKSDVSPSKISGPKSKSSRKKSKGLSNDDKVNQKAARRFNNEVRMCVEQSDPDKMREILRDRRNHKFALDAMVLETVMKAYVMAAMLEDALYCLKICTVPGTLSLHQTERILQCLPQNLRSSNAYAAADMINALCIATDFDSPSVRTYFTRIVRGIALEFLEEATSARDRICSASCERLVRSATCIVDSRLKRGKKPTELIVVPGDQLGVFVSDTMENRGIQAGDAVSLLPYAGPYPMSAESLDRNMIEATVLNTNPTVVRLQDKANAALHAMLTEYIDGNVYRIDKLANRMGFNRQLAAAVAFCMPIEENPHGVRDTRRPCPQLIKAVTAMDENINKVMRQGLATKGVLTSTAALCAEAIPWSVDDEKEDIDQDSLRTSSRLALEKFGAFEGLNTSQQLAVEGAVTHRLTLVQGPPGTGKTMTALRILQNWARLAEADRKPGADPVPILATSDSNIAVDNLVEGCAAVGLRVVRLGRPEAIRPELLRFCIDRPPPSYGNNSNSDSREAPYVSSVSSYKERMKQLKAAQVICCTCIGSGSDILDSLGPLERVLVDEATQATEPAVLVPLMRGCRQLVLVGDHCQLPPTVLSTRAEEEGHGVPLFSRMVACGVAPFMLDTQYRMHPCIAMFPSDLFYGGLLKNGVSAPERRPLAGFPWPREEFPVAFIPVKGVEMDDGVSKYNEEEAHAACNAVRYLLQGGQCTISDIAIVTPYAAQARLIRRIMKKLPDVAGPPYIEVSSVDGFQGREKEAVVFSAVRSNDYGAIGFTSDWRRINVSFTRARRALIVIGNDQTLRRGDPDTWMPWLAWVDAHGLNIEKPGVPRGRYDPEQLRRVRGGTTAAEMLKDVLARQQEQVKISEKEQERALKNAEGHIIGRTDDDEIKTIEREVQSRTLEENFALIENTEGNWDDSDDEHNTDRKLDRLSHSVSRTTLASGSSSADFRSDDANGVADAWDL